MFKHSICCIHIINGEGGIWTLAPCYRPTPFPGEPLSTAWVLLQTLEILHQMLCKKAERKGFEPLRPCGQTVFKTASLWPLRYLSITIIRLSVSLFISDIDYINKVETYCQHFFTIFFKFFYFLFFTPISCGNKPFLLYI